MNLQLMLPRQSSDRYKFPNRRSSGLRRCYSPWSMVFARGYGCQPPLLLELTSFKADAEFNAKRVNARGGEEGQQKVEF